MTVTLTAAQRRAIETVDRSIGIIAGAGAGKTRVLVERCAYLLAHTDTQLAQILAITFTERAAAELRARLSERLPADLRLTLQATAITTFHGFCARVLREHAPRLGVSPRFRLLEATEAQQRLRGTIETTVLDELSAGNEAIRQLVTEWEFRGVCNGLQQLVNDRWNVTQWMAASPQPPLPNTAAVLEAFTRCDAAYADAKRAQQVVDFHDLEIFALRIFDTHPEILSDYQRRFRHLLIDEVQDTNPIQMALLQRLFTPPDNLLCIVGDPKQSIYRFRGAEVRCFHAMLDVITTSGGAVVHLRENFRSRAGVIRFINAACPDIPAGEQLIAATGTPTEGAVEWLAVPLAAKASSAERRQTEAAAVAARIAELVVNEGVRYGDIACLFPTHLGVEPVVDALRTAGIPFHRYQGRGFLQRREVQDCLLAARFLANLATRQYDDGVLLGLLRSPLIGLTADLCYRLVHLSGPAAPQTDGLPPLHRAAFSHPPLAALFQYWQQRLPHCTVAEMLQTLIASTAYDAVLAELDPTGQASANLERLCTLAECAPDTQALDLAAFVAAMQDLTVREAGLADQPVQLAGDDAVQLLTIHAAKGNEFRVVFLLDCAAKRSPQFADWGFLPGIGLALRTRPPLGTATKKITPDPTDPWTALNLVNTTAEIQERDRLLYVALTRAAERIILPLGPAPEPDTETDNAVPNWPTRLTHACEALGIAPRTIVIATAEHTEEDAAAAKMPSQRLTPVEDLAQSEAAARALLHLTVTELEVLARCPQEYYLKYRLGLPGTLAWPEPTGLHEPLRGEVVHAVIARAAQEPMRTLAEITREELRLRGVDPSLVHHRELQHLLQHFTQTTTAQQGGAAEAAWHELPFHLRLTTTPSAIISGTIDLLQLRSDGWEIVDYKTDRIATAAEAEIHATRYALQMAVYALAAHEAGHRSLHRTTLHFLNTNTKISAPITAASLAATREQLQTLVQQIAAEDFTLATAAPPPCATCVYGRNRLCAHAAQALQLDRR
ncbi:MAG: ATP-dependent helicase [Deltaproteobacteria bacterium]|nr:ATP-dependent helicase [Deltaproteobacteria bacterium]